MKRFKIINVVNLPTDLMEPIQSSQFKHKTMHTLKHNLFYTTSPLESYVCLRA